MIAPFDLLGPLPEGTTVLEASAGTGKTYTIAGLVTRYVAEGVAALDELLVVTFGRAATQELRDRVRERLVSARDGLADPIAAQAGTDLLLRHLATGPDVEVQTRRRHLVRALASFDAATVATTHEWCSQMLTALGTAGDVDQDATLVENLDDLTMEVVDDLYVRKWGLGAAPVTPELSVTQARALARAVVGDPSAELVPTDGGGTAAVRYQFSLAVRAEVERRKRQRRVLGFDDLLSRLQSTLRDPQSGAAAKARLRARYRIVLVDEFQDTDPVQWDILDQAFRGFATLVLIGDPKQAIYAFRGADVMAYLAATEVADHHATLAQNWRSDPDLLCGLDRIFRAAALGDPRITVQPVSAAHAGRSLDTPDAPVQLRVVPSAGRSKVAVGVSRKAVAADVAREVVDLLDGAALWQPRDGSPARPVQPGDIAVLARLNDRLDEVAQALSAAGVPSVRRTTASVFATAAAADWIVLFEALEQPHRAVRLRRLAISPFVGWDAVDLEARDADALGLRLRHWLRVYDERGVSALFETVSHDQNLVARLLGEVDGERRLTDLRHVGETVHAAAMRDQLGLTASLEWLRRRADEHGTDTDTERSRRLDTDAAAVQLVTIHASKGLEFPVVLVPYGWDRYEHDVDIPRFHNATGQRVRNVGGPGAAGFDADAIAHNDEEFGEDLRLLYVALTRAQSRLVLWWAPSSGNTNKAPLHRLLFSDRPAVDVLRSRPVFPDDRALPTLHAFAEDGCLAVTEVGARVPKRWQQPPGEQQSLDVARLGRILDLVWRRTSYSALTRDAHDTPPAIGSEPEITDKDDEPTTPTADTASTSVLREVVSPMSLLPGGAAFGTLVHAVLERVDPNSADLAADLHDRAAALIPRLGPTGVDPGVLTEALLPSLRTPLGPLADGRALIDIAAADRLTELDFELPLRGGDRSAGPSAYLREVGDVLRRHLCADDPLAGYADLLDDPLLAGVPLKGFLTGSIDAVLRVDGRYLVVDYKTNRLGSPDAPLTAWDYRGDAMAQAMLHAHYPLQALLYEVALHRFLRWRVADYDPASHLGGALYLFLRGMCGPGVADPDDAAPGVFAWRPPPELVLDLSDLLAGDAS